ncbi:tyrosyl-tRNA synthetase [Tubulinosema ratisbonensis]|uniref:Tyrosine--tRNA ligase n=1 Tax=Tubulinosema ratisbonensis TaxID=291195 RepID=A0A437AIW3_9MICR|nr:tyrosyl-tRNA synthetase [Tubulinosema ratisbonensis]
MKVEDKLELITSNLEEVIGLEDLKEIIEKRPLKVYWGTATTGKPHIAYILPLLKIRDFVNAGCEVTILLADIHAVLDNLKAPLELINQRVKYYELLIKALLTELKVDLSKIKFVKGSSYQTSPEYTLELYKLTTLVTEHDSKKAGSEVVKQVKHIKLSSMIYPLMQCLDEHFLGCDAQFGGTDQRKIFTFSQKYLPMLNFKKRIHLMNPMIEGLTNQKMSSSDFFSKIEFTEKKEEIVKKVKKCFCEEKNVKGGLFQIIKYVVMPVLEIKKIPLLVKDLEKNEYNFFNFYELQTDFLNGKIHPSDLKTAVSEALELIVSPIRNILENNLEIVKEAYPSEK